MLKTGGCNSKVAYLQMHQIPPIVIGIRHVCVYVRNYHHEMKG